MIKRFLVAAGIIMCIVFCAHFLSAEEGTETILQGTIQEVAEDGSYIMMNDEKMMIGDELLGYTNMEAGDEVELTIEEINQQKVVISFDYIDL